MGESTGSSLGFVGETGLLVECGLLELRGLARGGWLVVLLAASPDLEGGFVVHDNI